MPVNRPRLDVFFNESHPSNKRGVIPNEYRHGAIAFLLRGEPEPRTSPDEAEIRESFGAVITPSEDGFGLRIEMEYGDRTSVQYWTPLAVVIIRPGYQGYVSEYVNLLDGMPDTIASCARAEVEIPKHEKYDRPWLMAETAYGKAGPRYVMAKLHTSGVDCAVDYTIVTTGKRDQLSIEKFYIIDQEAPPYSQ
jgi:hypothetical protein